MCVADGPGIDPEGWYAAREAAAFLDHEITEATVKAYCRSSKVEAKQIGPRKRWHVRGKDLLKLRAEWHLDG